MEKIDGELYYYQAKCSELNEEISKLQRFKKHHEREISELKAKLEEKEVMAIVDFTKRFEQVNGLVDELKTERAELIEWNSHLQSDIKELKGQLRVAFDSATEVKEQARKKLDEFRKQKSEIYDLKH